MADQIAKTKRDSIARNNGAEPIQGVKFRFVIPMVTIPRLDGQQIVDENRLKQLGVGAERPIHAEQDAALPFKKARDLKPEEAGTARAEGLAVLYRRGVDSVLKRDYPAGIADLERVIRQAPEDVAAQFLVREGALPSL